MKNFTNVYISKISDDLPIYEVYPAERKQYIKLTSNTKLKKQRYKVWKLLEEAINLSFCKKMDEVKFSEKEGKWTCDEFYFSLSHTDGAVAVVISNNCCGIDIENLSKRTESTKDFMPLAKRICTRNEISKIHSLNDLLALWTRKESIYKTLEMPVNSILEIESENYVCETYNIELSDHYIFSVCSDNPENINISII